MLEQMVVSFFASASFGILFSVPRKFLVACGVVGMIGWWIYIASEQVMTSIPATLLAAFSVTTLGLLFARFYKAPVTLFSVSGIVPLVPGGLAYDAMRYFVDNDYSLALQLSAKTLMTSGAIAMGLVVAEVIYRVVKPNSDSESH